MKLKTALNLIPVLLFFNLSIAQKNKMVLVYKDGTSQNGYGKLTSEKKIKFRKTRKEKAIKMAYEDLKNVKEIKFYGDEIEIYEFVTIKEGKVKLLERTAKGKVNLYRRLRITGSTFMPMGGMQAGGGMWTGGGTIKNYYVKRATEKVATHLGSNQLFTKSFVNAMSEYVKDCPELVSKITSKELRKRDLIEIIEFYNESCK